MPEDIMNFFEPMKLELMRFCGDANLELQKYPHAHPSWRFVFRHPRTGAAFLEIRRKDRVVAHISAKWDYWDIDNKIVRRTTSEVHAVNINDGSIRPLLINLLKRCMDWDEKEPGEKIDTSKQWPSSEVVELRKDYDAMDYPKPRIPSS